MLSLRTHITRWNKQDLILASKLQQKHIALLKAFGVNYIDHSESKLKRLKKKVNKGMVKKAITRGYLFEVHNNGGKALRYCYRYGVTCIAIEASEKGITVITVWHNAKDDNHKTLRQGQYNCQLTDIAKAYQLC